jgi:hypothetical protein
MRLRGRCRDQFLSLLPPIEEQARFAFRDQPFERRQELPSIEQRTRSLARHIQPCSAGLDSVRLEDPSVPAKNNRMAVVYHASGDHPPPQFAVRW